MTDKFKDADKELGEEKENIAVYNLSFKIPITEDEAKEVVNNSKGSVARKLKTYMRKVLETGCKKMLEVKEENVNDCKFKVE